MIVDSRLLMVEGKTLIRDLIDETAAFSVRRRPENASSSQINNRHSSIVNQTNPPRLGIAYQGGTAARCGARVFYDWMYAEVELAGSSPRSWRAAGRTGQQTTSPSLFRRISAESRFPPNPGRGFGAETPDSVVAVRRVDRHQRRRRSAWRTWRQQAASSGIRHALVRSVKSVLACCNR
jgi:hypothetical protein